MSADPAPFDLSPFDLSPFDLSPFDLSPFDLSGRPAASLAEVVAGAAQLTRVDRKYLVTVATATALLDRLPSCFRVLSLDGRRETTYLSTYFDTRELASCRAHVQRRRRRWKARSRLYVEDDLCRIEVKSRDGRGVTEKTVAASDPGRYGRLLETERRFLTSTLADRHPEADVPALRPTAEVRYRRTTLADTGPEPSRVTLDWRVHCTLAGRRAWIDDGFVLVETKGGLRPSTADRTLTGLGARPRSFSKYVTAAALLRDDIPDNDVRRLQGRVLHTDAPWDVEGRTG